MLANHALRGGLGPAMTNAGLPALAWCLLRVCRPLHAHALLLRVGALLPELTSAQDVRLAMGQLLGPGTCLSRALAIAARAPTADVVIGVSPNGQGPLLAHAWIEIDGEPIDASSASGAAIARLHGPRSATRRASAASSIR